MTGHEGRCIRTEPDHCSSDLLRLTNASERYDAFHLVLRLLIATGEADQQLCIDRARAHDVHPNPCFGILNGCGFREPDYPTLTCRINGHAWDANHPQSRGNVHNSAPLLQHSRYLRFEREPGSFEINGNGPLPPIFGQGGNRADGTFRSGTIHSIVEPPVGGDDRLDQMLNIAGLAHIGLHEEGVSSLLCDEMDGFLPLCNTPPSEGDLRSFPDKGQCCCAANPRSSSSHEGDFSFKLAHTSFPFQDAIGP